MHLPRGQRCFGFLLNSVQKICIFMTYNVINGLGRSWDFRFGMKHTRYTHLNTHFPFPFQTQDANKTFFETLSEIWIHIVLEFSNVFIIYIDAFWQIWQDFIQRNCCTFYLCLSSGYWTHDLFTIINTMLDQLSYTNNLL